MTDKPRQGFRGLWNISFGFFGIQLAFGLQNANVSRIFQSLGSNIDELAFLWIAGPVTGLLVQPLIGHFSDRTWLGRMGRRRPYFLGGAILAAAALTGMPHSQTLLAAAVMLWMLDAALNIAMEPFRAFVADMVGPRERTAGYAMQTAFIGAGAVIGSLAPAAFAALGISNTAPAGAIAESVRYSFYLGAAAILCAVLWTVVTTREYSPDEMRAFEGRAATTEAAPLVAPRRGWAWAAGGLALLLVVRALGLDKQLYVLGGTLLAFGLAQVANAARAARERNDNVLGHILSDLAQMPGQMKRLALTQFFSWIALFIMWIYTTPVVTRYVFGATDPASPAYGDGADWVGVLFSVYNGVAALAALGLPLLARRIGPARTHMVGLLAGALGYAGFLVIRDAHLLLLPMVGIGIAWASILTMPYVILAGVLPQDKLGMYMGIFNFFIVLPQLLVATVMGGVIRTFFPDEPVWTMLVAALVMLLAALSVLRVAHEPEDRTA